MLDFYGVSNVIGNELEIVRLSDEECSWYLSMKCERDRGKEAQRKALQVLMNCIEPRNEVKI